MNEQIKKSACGVDTLQAKNNINNSDLILSECEQIVKCVTTTKLLSNYQRLVIRRVYYTSHDRKSLIERLKGLKFCTYSVAVKALHEQELIDDEDYFNLLEEENNK